MLSRLRRYARNWEALLNGNLLEATFEEQADLVARLGSKILASKDLKSSKISCRLNLVRVNHERGQAGFAKVTFGGAEGIRTPDLLLANYAIALLSTDFEAKLLFPASPCSSFKTLTLHPCL